MALVAGADIDRASTKQGPPLAIAASMGKLRMVRYLANKGAQLTWEMPDGVQHSAIEKAQNYPHIQRRLRDFYERK